MNTIVLVGRLVADPSLRYTQTGTRTLDAERQLLIDYAMRYGLGDEPHERPRRDHTLAPRQRLPSQKVPYRAVEGRGEYAMIGVRDQRQREAPSTCPQALS